MDRGKVVGVLVATLVLVSMAGPAAATDHAAAAAPEDVDPDAVHIGIDVDENGDATWTIEYRVRLSDENETDAYEDIVADVENNRSAYIDRFETRMNGTVEAAEDQTGRSMEASNFTVSAEIRELPQTYGVMTYTFEWQNFAVVDDETVRIGDALEGFFLDDETTMLVSWPASYTPTTVEPAPTEERSGAVVWDGPLEFAGEEPLVVVTPTELVTTTQTGELPSGMDDALLLVASVFGVLIALILAAVWYYRTRTDEEGGGSTAIQADSDDGADTSPTPVQSEDETPPDELLSNEERVTRFLEDHGGRAKQQEIVDGLEWTEAKTSQVLSSMESEGAIEKFRIGRENVVKLPDGEDEL
ncbi:MAG: DUF7345 domain-containing protein [archaeon]